MEDVVVDICRRPPGGIHQAPDLRRHMNREREKLLGARRKVSVNRRRTQVVVLRQRLVPDIDQARAAAGQRLPGDQNRSGGVANRQAGSPRGHVFHRLDVIADVIAHQLAGAHQRRLQLVVQSEVTGDDVQRLNEPRTGTRYVYGVQRFCAQTPGHLGRGGRLERRSGDPAVDQEVDLGCLDAVLPEARGRRARGELTGRQRRVRLDVAHLGIAPVEHVADALLDRLPLGYGAAERIPDTAQYRVVIESLVRKYDRGPGEVDTGKVHV